MPEYPEITVYVECLERRIAGSPLERIRLVSPFLLRSVDPPWREAQGRVVREVRRIGKRIVLALECELFLVLHLMIAGRLRWRDRGAKPPGRDGLAAFDFPSGTLVLTEAGSKKRASLHVVRGETALAEHDPGGLEVVDSSREEFHAALVRESRTLKRALTDPAKFSGIGNAYSDEILHRARLSPFKKTRSLDGDELARLHAAGREVLLEWTDRLRRDVGEGFPEKVTAFKEGLAVHGRYGEPCPVCGTRVARVVHSESEFDYCPGCQTGGRVLADRSLSRLLGKDWPPPDW